MAAGIPFMESLLGNVMGAAGKAAFFGVKAAWKVTSAVAPPALHAAFALGTPAVKAATVGAARTAGFGLRHPETAMTIGAGALGIYALSQTGAQERSMTGDEMDYLARMTGPSTGFTPGTGSMAYDPNRMAFIDSTQGLSLGLHRGRHG